MRVALICNTTAAFPHLEWLNSQGVLAGIAVKEQKKDFFSNLTVICKQKKIIPQILIRENLSQ